MWQKCPICNGTGTTFYPLSSSTSAVCTVCDGRKIISYANGNPPGMNDIINNRSIKSPGSVWDNAELNRDLTEDAFF